MKKVCSLGWLILLWCAVLPCTWTPGARAAGVGGECLDCHSDTSLTTIRDGREVALFVDEQVYAASVHGEAGLACDECHADIKEIPHPEQLKAVDCGACHDEVAARYRRSRHGQAAEKGFLGTAVCRDCHGSHEILATADPASPASRKRLADTCARCHAGAATAYAASAHGAALARGSASAATCGSCHDPHGASRVDQKEFLLGSVETCGGCHEKALQTYRASYHGQVSRLGFPGVAKCFDCHGSHEILPPSNPESLVGAQRELETCRKCHPAARKKFLGYAPHLDHSDRVKFRAESLTFAFMNLLLWGVFLFFCFHSLMWFIRGIIAKVRHEGPPHLGNPTGRYFLRLNYYHRITHFLVFTSFVTLGLTGLPLKYAEYQWAQKLAVALGGFEVAGTLHRLMGVVTFGYFGLHLAFLAYVAISGRMKILEMLWGPKSIVPQPQDAIDLTNMFKWFLGLAPRPHFGRWTYWEKFDYLAVFWGVAIIGFSGLVLWLPVTFTRLLPGMAVNIAWIVHSDEALLATGFIFLIHFFNTHLRAEKFPLDPVILTGRISEEEMRHERPKEFSLRRADGSLREIQTTPPPLWMRNFARGVGWVFVALGFALLVGMVLAFFI